MNGARQDATSATANLSSSRSSRPAAMKRDSLTAELERDPQFSASKRQQRTNAFTSSMAHASLERQLLQARSEKVELEAKLRERDSTIERLEGDRRLLALREQSEREEKEQEQTAREKDKSSLHTEILRLRTSLLRLEEERSNSDDAHSQFSRSTTQMISAQKSQLAELTRRVKFFEDESITWKSTAEERSQKLQELVEENDALRSCKASEGPATMDPPMGDDWKVVRDELTRQASYLRDLESSNARMSRELDHLRQRNKSIEVLEEQNRDLKHKLTNTDALRDSVGRLEVEVEAARKEREEWASKTHASELPARTPASVTRSLTSLRLEHGCVLEEFGALKAALRQKEREMLDLTTQDERSRQTVACLEKQLKVLDDKVGRNERRAILAEREVSFLQAMLTSYSAEDTGRNSTTVDQAKEQRLTDLEKLLSEYKSSIKELEAELDAIGGNASSLGSGKTREQLQSQIEDSNSKIETLENDLKEAEEAVEGGLTRIEELEQKLFDLGGEIGAGRQIPPGTRVLTLKDNPVQQEVDLRQATLDRLKGENEALLEKLAALETGGRDAIASSADLVPKESWDVMKTEKAELVLALEHREKRIKRLQEIYAKKSGEFREVVSSILGFKLAFNPNGTVRMTSVYDLNAVFVFKPAMNGNATSIQLVGQGEGGPDDLPQLMRHWLEEVQCMPGFMASVTLGCIENAGGRVQGQTD
ncbi:MAD-domain-containing protein [Thelephora ganbajun]|uniref:MAD-domain-containing protein n=1 Tax=Thelephora ganbajun TaxID=370292 RepID=A0ACB6ZKV9_THEGA|nr:MAD-domain-containing protein [Thelephora ganbajun]